jgi:hypothetical protein
VLYVLYVCVGLVSSGSLISLRLHLVSLVLHAHDNIPNFSGNKTLNGVYQHDQGLLDTCIGKDGSARFWDQRGDRSERIIVGFINIGREADYVVSR